MNPTTAPGGWRLAAGCVAGLGIVAALVVWRSLHTDGGWLLAVRLTGVVAVFGLIVAIWLALRPTDTSSELVLRVSAGGSGPVTETVPSAAVPEAATVQRRALAVALAAVVPALLVVVLAVPAEAGEAANEPTSSSSAPAATPTESQPEPTESPEPTTEPTSEPTTEPPTTEPPTTGPPTTGPPTTGPPTTGPPTTGPPTTGPPTTGPPTTGPPAAETSSFCPAGPPEPYVVVAGDSLWAIAERSLLGSGSDTEIDALWRQVYDRNRDVIGPDPDLIIPGQQILACR